MGFQTNQGYHSKPSPAVAAGSSKKQHSIGMTGPFDTYNYSRGKFILPEHERWKLQRNPFEREMDMFDFCARKGINPRYVNPCTMLICLEEEDPNNNNNKPKQSKPAAVEHTASFSVLQLLLGNDDRSLDIAKHILPELEPCSVMEFI